MFTKAKKSQSRARIALLGPSGSGKTYTALLTAAALGKHIAVLDTEHGSAAKYADLFDFDIAELASYSPDNYIRAIREAEAAGYDVLIIDSLSHEWSGSDGVLEIVDRAAAKYKDNRFSAWRDATPIHNRLIQAIVSAGLHIIATMRTKTEWILTEDSRGRMVPKRVGTAAVQRDGIEYEFDIVAELDLDHKLTVIKTRCMALDGYSTIKPGREFGEIVKSWLDEGVPANAVPARPAELNKLAEVATQAGIPLDQLQSIVIEVVGKASSSELTSADVQKCIRHLYTYPASTQRGVNMPHGEGDK